MKTLRAVAAIVLCAGVAVAVSEQPVGAKDELPRAVRRVLTDETHLSRNDWSRRDRLDSELRQAKSSDETVRWQTGFVKVKDRWIPFELADPATSRNARRHEYQQKRSETLRTVKEQAELGVWCSRNGFVEESQAHNHQALMLSPLDADPSEFYRRMNYVRVGTSWLNRPEALEAQRELVDYLEQLEQGTPSVQRFAEELERGFLTEISTRDRLKQLASASKAPALEVVLTRRSEVSAKAGVDALRQIPTYQAAEALGRVAVTSPWLFVRDAALAGLKERRQQDYVPQWLSMFHTPVRTEFQRFTWGEHQGVMCLFRRDREFEMDFGQLNVWALNPNRPFIGPRDWRQLQTYQTAVKLRLQRELDAVERLVDAQNDEAEVLNERISRGLAATTAMRLGDDPQRWWDWWQEQSGFDPVPATFKRIRIVKEDDLFVNVAPPPQLPPPTAIHSCLVAGTPIWTEQGLVPIEQIQPGDRVLAKHVETGELAYKVVLHTTVRSPVPITKFHVSDDTIQASGGHHFWVSGSGWRKMRELAVEQPLHTATGALRITSLESAETAPVYNLVVADFHTYFVGRSAILSHDVLPPKPTNKTVPGLEEN